ncbi:hypothetical protein [Flaviflexus huanghaiensis]|uniref:hypothetical protein n=1 Tax=Flaviflexus huanghaiensis TaxID=1111473 RepID=UPI0015F9AA61|nr:hypothetical protein [Flaviflexus huanghaiensis]
MFVLTLDQIGSRGDEDRVPALLERLRDKEMVRPFERTVGDEVQGVTADPTVVRKIVLGVLRDGHWHIGIGSGPAELGGSAREGSGTAFENAREAVERAKSATRFTPSVATIGPNQDTSADAEALLRLLGNLIESRTDAQWEAIDAHRAGETASQIAERLGISAEAVSQRRGLGGQALEEACWPLLDRLLIGTEQ